MTGCSISCLRKQGEWPANRLIALGIKGFWNFTNVELSSNDPSVKFENIHFADSLLALSYRIANR